MGVLKFHAFNTVTEEEIVKGILENDDRNNNCLVFFRKLIYHDHDSDEMIKEGYFDDKAEDIKLMKKLKKKIKSKLSARNIFYREV